LKTQINVFLASSSSSTGAVGPACCATVADDAEGGHDVLAATAMQDIGDMTLSQEVILACVSAQHLKSSNGAPASTQRLSYRRP
jgi:hypothetical protein